MKNNIKQVQQHLAELYETINEETILELFFGITEPSIKKISSSPLDHRVSANSLPPKLLNKTAAPRNPSLSPSQKISASNMATPNSARPKSATGNKPSQRNAMASSRSGGVTRDDLVACKFCNRRFAQDRLQIHEDICARTGKKKRKQYDALKHRLQGTDLEPYVKKNRTATPKRPSSGKKTDWRRKHEEFISTIRAAKMAQAHIAKGGKISDLPPPPPSYNPDYVQCPHCGRRFNETAAERHIPKCATYLHNKPKNAPPKRK